MDAATRVLIQRMDAVEAAIGNSSAFTDRLLIDRLASVEARLEAATKKIETLESKLSRVRRKKTEE